ncbi:hypothetical protein J6590_095155, partial [Homalodisca vitripennis]
WEEKNFNQDKINGTIRTGVQDDRFGTFKWTGMRSTNAWFTGDSAVFLANLLQHRLQR